MHRLLKLIQIIQNMLENDVLRRENISDRRAFVVARAGSGIVDWYFADNIADKKVKKTRKS